MNTTMPAAHTTPLASSSSSSSWSPPPPSSSSKSRSSVKPSPHPSSVVTQTPSARHRTTRIKPPSTYVTPLITSPHSSPPSTFTPSVATVITTRVVTPTHQTTLTITSKAVLSSNSPTDSDRPFAHNGGAIAGLVIGGVISLTFAILWFTLARRRYRSSLHDISPDHSPTPTQNPWRLPLDDDANPDPGMTERRSQVPASFYTHPLSFQEGDPFNVLQSGTAAAAVTGRRLSSTRPMRLGNVGSPRDGNISPLSPHSPTTPSTAGFLDAGITSNSPDPLWPRPTSGSSRYDSPSPLPQSYYYPRHHYEEYQPARRSSVSLTDYPDRSRVTFGRDRRSTSSQILNPTPPSSFAYSGRINRHDSANGTNGGLKNLIGLLGRRNRNSAPASMSGTPPLSSSSSSNRPPTATRGSSEWQRSLSTVSGTVRSPSPLVSGVPKSGGPREDTLPPTPPPDVETARSSMALDDPRMKEGLLDPRLRLGLMNQDSTASLGDHRDYSRPISGLVHNRRDSMTSRESLTNEG